MKKQVFTVLCVLIFLLSAAACGKEPAGEETAAASEDLTVSDETGVSSKESEVSESAASSVSESSSVTAATSAANASAAVESSSGLSGTPSAPSTAVVSPEVITTLSPAEEQSLIAQATTNTGIAAQPVSGTPELYVVISNPTPVRGETVTVSVHLRNVQYLCTLGAQLAVDSSALTVDEYYTEDVPGIMSYLNYVDNQLSYAGMSMQTLSVADNTLFTAECKVNSSGTIPLNLYVSDFQIGTDASGTATRSAEDSLLLTGAVLTVN